MKKTILASLFAASLLSASDKAVVSLIPMGIWPLCRQGFQVPGCNTPPDGNESNMIAINQPDQNVVNFHWHLRGTRELDGKIVDLEGTLDRNNTDTTTIILNTGILLPGYTIEVTERVNRPERPEFRSAR